MEISLDNIRCYDRPSTFKFPAKGLVLLQGMSGSGKSTILDGITFALYGVGKNLVTHGYKKCKVALAYDGWNITRTRSPNRLVLIDENGDQYEDDAAQEIINEKYGTNFTITSYVTQLNPKGMDSFFYLGPADRMAFLEKLAIGEIDVGELKKKCKLKIKERKERVNQKVGQLQAIEEECKTVQCPTVVEFPLNGKFSEIKVKNESVKKVKNEKALSKARSALVTIKEEYAEHNIKKLKHSHIQADIEKIQNQLESVVDEKSGLQVKSVDDLEGRIEYLKLNKDLAALKLSYNSSSQEYQALCVIELAQYKDELDKLLEYAIIDDQSNALNKLSKAYDSKCKLEKRKRTIQDEIAELDTEDAYAGEIAELREKEQELMTQKIKCKSKTISHKCPKCSVYLRIGTIGLELAEIPSNDITRSEQEIDSELKTIRSDRTDYEENLRELKSLKSRLEKLNNEIKDVDMQLDSAKDIEGIKDIAAEHYNKYYTKHVDELREQTERLSRISAIKNKIKNGDFSMTVQAIKRKLDTKEANIKQMEYSVSKCLFSSVMENENDMDKLKDEIVSSKLINQKYDMLSKQETKLNNELSKLKKSLAAIVLDDIDYDKEIVVQENIVNELIEEDRQFREREKLLQLFLKYKDELERYNKWQEKLLDARECEKNSRISLVTAEKLLRKIQETESASVVNTIDSINHHMKYYLEKFFTDPIEVEISSFKSTAKGDKKPSINIQVGYKGVETDISCLSGGERARVEVSICLAINALVGSRLILLDESMSSLDADTVEGITEVLRHDADTQDKLIITVLHQANQGQFNNVINVEDKII